MIDYYNFYRLVVIETATWRLLCIFYYIVIVYILLLLYYIYLNYQVCVILLFICNFNIFFECYLDSNCCGLN